MNTLKAQIFETLHASGHPVYVRLRRGQGVNLPPFVKDTDGYMVLVYGLNLDGAPTDPHFGPAGLACRLRFNGVQMPTFVPWERIVAIHGHGCIAAFEVPKEPEPVKPGLRLVRNAA